MALSRLEEKEKLKDPQQLVYQERAEQIQKKSSSRMGYPVTGPISGEYTLFGWKRNRTESKSATKLVDTRCLGIVPDSPSDTLMINIGGQLQVSRNGLPVEPVRSGAWQAEIEILHMFADFYHLAREQIRGYVTSGGTEGNLACLWWSREYLKAKYGQMPILYLSNQAHYSVLKIANILGLTSCIVQTDKAGKIDLERFSQLIKQHTQTSPEQPVLVCATVGTTQMGAIDDVPAIKQILTNELRDKQYAIHVDAALLGAVMPIIKPFGKIDRFFDYMDTIAISGHKFLGTTSICGVALAKKEILEYTYQDKDILVKYVGGIQDTTVSGTRSGKIVMELHLAMCSLDMNSNYTRLNKLVTQCLINANYFRIKLGGMVGVQHITYNPGQFVVVFPKPKNENAAEQLEDKYGLMTVGDNRFAVYVLAPVDQKLIDEFLEEYQAAISQEKRVSLRACL